MFISDKKARYAFLLDRIQIIMGDEFKHLSSDILKIMYWIRPFVQEYLIIFSC